MLPDSLLDSSLCLSVKIRIHFSFSNILLLLKIFNHIVINSTNLFVLIELLKKLIVHKHKRGIHQI